MKFIFPVLTLLVFLGATNSQADEKNARASSAEAVTQVTKPSPFAESPVWRRSVHIDNQENWKGWLEHTFPDASKTWPADCAKAFDLIEGDGKWDFVGKGNIDRDGVPTAMMIRVRNVKGNDEENLIVADLRISKWMAGKWEEMLRLSDDEGMIVGGVKPGAMQSSRFHGYEIRFFVGYPTNAQSPGIRISASAVDEKGKAVTENTHLHYFPKLKKYGGQTN